MKDKHEKAVKNITAWRQLCVDVLTPNEIKIIGARINKKYGKYLNPLRK